MEMKNEKRENAKSVVALVPCPTYRVQLVDQAVRLGVERLGGMGKFARPEERVLVKPNFLTGAAPEAAVTTHPAVVSAVCRLLREAGCRDVRYGDSPGHGSCASAAAKSAYASYDMHGAKQTPMNEPVRVEYPQGRTAQEFYFAREVTETDALINVCKMKTHALERVTGAVKNLYGLVEGTHKAAGHVKYPNASIFARQLADIHRLVKPRLHIMDGILAMEGNGPGSGDPLPMNVLLFSEDPVALDAVFCHLVYLDPELVPTCAQGMAMGIGTYRADKIEVWTPVYGREKTDGDPAWQQLSLDEVKRRFGCQAFRVNRTPEKKSLFNRYSDVMTHFSRRPVIDRQACVHCGVCVSHCPVPGGALHFSRGKDAPPVYDYKKCIRCYCCQEMCPKHAIRVRGKF